MKTPSSYFYNRLLRLVLSPFQISTCLRHYPSFMQLYTIMVTPFATLQQWRSYAPLISMYSSVAGTTAHNGRSVRATLVRPYSRSGTSGEFFLLVQDWCGHAGSLLRRWSRQGFGSATFLAVEWLFRLLGLCKMIHFYYSSLLKWAVVYIAQSTPLSCTLVSNHCSSN